MPGGILWLWSIFDFLMPGFLYPYSRFRERLESPIVKNGSRQALDRLSKMTGPFILRRLKRDVLKELPPKTESVLATTMETEQRQLYLANAAQIKRDLARQMEEGGFQASRMTILAMLTRLRQLCCGPSLFLEHYHSENAKLDTCMELLREASETGHKVLLFSQFTSMLAILADALDREGLSYFLLQGSTSKEKRAAMVDSFNRDGTQVFLISLKAGGTGLNLTGADIVIHYDPWWNVAAQNQATDRAYRIGQVNPVQVYRLIAKDTLEEKILLDTFAKYGAEDMGSEYGEKWWKEKITFFYPGNMMDLPQMFGTMDTIAPYDKIENIYWAMKKAIETNFPQAKFIAHFSHWYEWGCMVYDRFIIDNPPQDPHEALRLHNAVWSCGVRTALANGGVVNDHHGVGIKLGRLMKEQYGSAMQVFEGLKKQLDPNGIMNPYKLGL